MKVVGYLAVFFGGVVASYLLVSLGVVDKLDGIPGTQEDPTLSLPTYLSFLSVMMTSVTAVLAAVAIGIGVVAFYTFPGLKAEARIVAENSAKDVAATTAQTISAEALSDLKVRSIILEIIGKVQKEREYEREWGADPTDSEER